MIQDYSRNISGKVLSNYLQWLCGKCHFSFSSLQVYKKSKLPWQPNQRNVFHKKKHKTVNAYMMKISTKSHPHRAYGFGERIFLSIFSFLFCILVSMAAKENVR